MSMTDKKIFKNEFQAWEWIKEMFPDTEWKFDKESSERAGYKTYRDTNEFYNYICMLNDKVEVNLKEGNQTINLWIEKEEPDVKGSEPATWYKLTDSEVSRICNRIYTVVAAAAKSDNERGTYDNIYEMMEDLKLIDRLMKTRVSNEEI